MRSLDDCLSEGVRNHPHYNSRTGLIEKEIGGIWKDVEKYKRSKIKEQHQ